MGVEREREGEKREEKGKRKWGRERRGQKGEKKRKGGKQRYGVDTPDFYLD